MRDEIFPDSLYRRMFYDYKTHTYLDYPLTTQKYINTISLNSLRLQHLEQRVRITGIRLLGIRSFYIMARNMNTIEWVNIRLNRSDKKAFDTWAKDNLDDMFELEAHLLHAGYKIARSYDQSKDCVIVTITAKSDTPINALRGYTSRSNDLTEAVMMALYKHWVLANGSDWNKIATSDDSWG